MQGKNKPLTKRQQYRYWLDKIKDWKASGQSISAYSRAQGFTAQAMYAGKKELVKKGVLPRSQKPRFQRVAITSKVTDNAWCIQLPNGLSVRFAGTANAAELATVLSAAATIA